MGQPTDYELGAYGRELMRKRYPSEVDLLRAALAPLVAIADAYDANDLDDEARKRWGENYEYTQTKRPSDIELYSGRGGKRLLTLADCLAARAALRP